MARRRMLLAVFVLAALAAGALGARQSAPPYPTPVGTQVENGVAGFSKVICSAIFVSGRDLAEATQHSVPPFMPNSEVPNVKLTIDREHKAVRATLGNITRESRLYGDQGCIIQ